MDGGAAPTGSAACALAERSIASARSGQGETVSATRGGTGTEERDGVPLLPTIMSVSTLGAPTVDGDNEEYDDGDSNYHEYRNDDGRHLSRRQREIEEDDDASQDNDEFMAVEAGWSALSSALASDSISAPTESPSMTDSVRIQFPQKQPAPLIPSSARVVLPEPSSGRELLGEKKARAASDGGRRARAVRRRGTGWRRRW